MLGDAGRGSRIRCQAHLIAVIQAQKPSIILLPITAASALGAFHGPIGPQGPTPNLGVPGHRACAMSGVEKA